MSQRKSPGGRRGKTAMLTGAGVTLIPLAAVFVMDTPPAAASQSRFTFSLCRTQGCPAGTSWHTPVVDKTFFGNVSMGNATSFVCATGYYRSAGGQYLPGSRGVVCEGSNSGFNTLLTSVYTSIPVTAAASNQYYGITASFVY